MDLLKLRHILWPKGICVVLSRKAAERAWLVQVFDDQLYKLFSYSCPTGCCAIFLLTKVPTTLKLSNEAKFGLIAVVTIFLVLVGLNYLGGSQLFGPPLVLYAKYDDVEGLLPGNPINISGLQVGRVDDISLDMGSGKLTARLEFRKDLDIPANSRAMIYSTDVLGSKGIKIFVPDTLGTSTDYLSTGDEIAGMVETGIFAEAEDLVKNQGAQILVEVARLSVQLNEIVQQTTRMLNDENTQQSIRSTLENIEEVTRNLTNITREVDSLAGNINLIANDAKSIVSNVQTNNEEISGIITNVRRTTDTLAIASEDVRNLMRDASGAVANVESLMAKMDTTTGTLGKLLNDSQLYDSLTVTTEEVNRLLREVNANPQRFFDDLKLYLIERKKK